MHCAPIRYGWASPFACAQSRCPTCQDAFVRQHAGLVHVVLRRQARGGVAYEDLLQEGRIALWQAVTL